MAVSPALNVEILASVSLSTYSSHSIILYIYYCGQSRQRVSETFHHVLPARLPIQVLIPRAQTILYTELLSVCSIQWYMVWWTRLSLTLKAICKYR